MSGIKTCQVVVPNKACINSCKFCCSRLHCNDYENKVEDLAPPIQGSMVERSYYKYINSLKFAREIGYNSIMLTGTSEPQQNMPFIENFMKINSSLPNPFYNTEIQTTGRMLAGKNIELLSDIGINTFSISVSSINSRINSEILGLPEGEIVDVRSLTRKARECGMLVRVSLILTNEYDSIVKNRTKTRGLFEFIHEDIKADQITFRKLYNSNDGSPQSKWITKNAANENVAPWIELYIKNQGEFLETLEFGDDRYSCHGMSTVLMKDCMNVEANKKTRYVILRPDCSIYTRWDDAGSRIM